MSAPAYRTGTYAPWRAALAGDRTGASVTEFVVALGFWRWRQGNGFVPAATFAGSDGLPCAVVDGVAVPITDELWPRLGRHAITEAAFRAAEAGDLAPLNPGRKPAPKDAAA